LTGLVGGAKDDVVPVAPVPPLLDVGVVADVAGAVLVDGAAVELGVLVALGAAEFTEKFVPVVTVTSAPSAVLP